MPRIPEVVGVKIGSFGINPKTFVILAVGKVTAGWTDPALEPIYPYVPPADGIQEFELWAKQPTNYSYPLEMPLAALATTTRDIRNYWGMGNPLKGVRILARTNKMEALVEDNAFVSMSEGMLLPWPFPFSHESTASGELPFPFMVGGEAGVNSLLNFLLVGKTLRTHSTGEVVTDEYKSDRATIELNPHTERIASVRIG